MKFTTVSKEVIKPLQNFYDLKVLCFWGSKAVFEICLAVQPRMSSNVLCSQGIPKVTTLLTDAPWGCHYRCTVTQLGLQLSFLSSMPGFFGKM
jgi:hypothetical protein